MRAKQLQDLMGARTWALIFSTGDEVMSNLERFAESNHLAGSHFTAIGACQRIVLAWFDYETKHYRKIPVDEQVEIVSLMGDVSLDEKQKPKVHAHVVVGKSDGSALGGHLVEAQVRPTLELILTESPQHLQRRFDAASGLGLIQV